MNRKQPTQPMVVDERGVVCFQSNKVIEWLFEAGKLDLIELAVAAAKNPAGFPRADRMQVAQMLGYSVSGFGDLSYVPRDVAGEMDAAAAEVLKGWLSKAPSVARVDYVEWLRERANDPKVSGADHAKLRGAAYELERLRVKDQDKDNRIQRLEQALGVAMDYVDGRSAGQPEDAGELAAVLHDLRQVKDDK